MMGRLDSTGQCLEGKGVRSTLHPAFEDSDGAIEAQLDVWVDFGDWTKVLWAIEECFGDGGMTEMYVQPMFIFGKPLDDFQEADKRYERYKGSSMYSGNYFMMTTHSIISMFLTLKHILIPNNIAKHKSKIEMINIKLHWNPEHKKPHHG